MHIISLTLTTAPNAFTVDQCPEYSIVLHVRAYLQSDKYVVWSSYTEYNRLLAVFLWKTQNVPNGGVPILCILSFLYSFTFFIYIVYICFQDYIISFIVWKTGKIYVEYLSNCLSAIIIRYRCNTTCIFFLNPFNKLCMCVNVNVCTRDLFNK